MYVWINSDDRLVDWAILDEDQYRRVVTENTTGYYEALTELVLDNDYMNEIIAGIDVMDPKIWHWTGEEFEKIYTDEQLETLARQEREYVFQSDGPIVLPMVEEGLVETAGIADSNATDIETLMEAVAELGQLIGE